LITCKVYTPKIMVIKSLCTLESQDNTMFEDPDEYMRYLRMDRLETMNNWVLSI